MAHFNSQNIRDLQHIANRGCCASKELCKCEWDDDVGERIKKGIEDCISEHFRAAVNRCGPILDFDTSKIEALLAEAESICG